MLSAIGPDRPAAGAGHPSGGRHRWSSASDRHQRAIQRPAELFATLYDYTLVDMSQAIDDFNLQLFDEADVIYVVMTAGLSCLKNCPLCSDDGQPSGMSRQGPARPDRVECVHRINVSNAESALGRKIDYQVINEYRGAISALNSGERSCPAEPMPPEQERAAFAEILTRPSLPAPFQPAPDPISVA